MLRLVAAHRNSLLEATRRHVAQALQASGDFRAAENYYIQAGQYYVPPTILATIVFLNNMRCPLLGDWKSAIQMYRTAGQWEGAERVARAHAPSNVQQQVRTMYTIYIFFN